MKRENGITLMMLIIYVVGLTIVAGIVAVITNFFYQNINTMDESASGAAEFSKFNVVFLEEVKTYGNNVKNIETNSVEFATGNKYTFKDSTIYKNKIPIVRGVEDCQFRLRTYEAKEIVQVFIQTEGDNGFSRINGLCGFV